MQKVKIFIKSIISPERPEEIYLLHDQNSTNFIDSLYDLNEMTVDNQCSYQNTESNFVRDQSRSDLNFYSERSKSNQIDEYQAAWNITNAIQVKIIFCQIFDQFSLKTKKI